MLTLLQYDGEDLPLSHEFVTGVKDEIKEVYHTILQGKPGNTSQAEVQRELNRLRSNGKITKRTEAVMDHIVKACCALYTEDCTFVHDHLEFPRAGIRVVPTFDAPSFEVRE